MRIHHILSTTVQRFVRLFLFTSLGLIPSIGTFFEQGYKRTTFRLSHAQGMTRKCQEQTLEEINQM